MAPHSSILAWEIPWTEELVAYSPWNCKEVDTTQGLRHRHTHRSWKGKLNGQHWGQWNRSLTRNRQPFPDQGLTSGFANKGQPPHMVSSRIPHQSLPRQQMQWFILQEEVPLRATALWAVHSYQPVPELGTDSPSGRCYVGKVGFLCSWDWTVLKFRSGNTESNPLSPNS